jgi:hypothetical protein
VGEQALSLRRNAPKSLYVFCLVLSKYGHLAGPPKTDGAQLFEDVSLHVAAALLGGSSNGVERFAFGSPRRVEPAGFADAVTALCDRLGEGVGPRGDEARMKNMKDGGLDVVVWRGFPDRRAGQLVAMGQCATGEGWPTKVSDLRVDVWPKSWMHDTPMVPVVPLFFTPRRVELTRWRTTSIAAGVVFDRCRVVAHELDVPIDLRKACGEWAAFALAEAAK